MRTTLDIAEDVLLAVKALSKRENKSAGQIISELARKGLMRPASEETITESDEFLGFRPLPSRGVIVTPELIEKLREEDSS